MQKTDIEAHVEALNELAMNFKNLKGKVDKLHNFSAIQNILGILKEEAEGWPASGNIAGILGEVEDHCTGLAGLYPSYSLEPEMHLTYVLSSISKLMYPTAFGQNRD